MNYKRTNSWWVRTYDFKGKPVQKSFPVFTHGGVKKALKLAILWRNKVGNCINEKKGLTRSRHIQKRSSLNKSGIIGVTLNEKIIDGRVYKNYVGCYYINKFGPIGRKSFAVRKYGDKKALRLATQFRHAGVRSILSSNN